MQLSLNSLMMTSIAFTCIAEGSILFASLLWLKKQDRVQIQLLLLQIRGLHGSNLKWPETALRSLFLDRAGSCALIHFSTSVVHDGDDLEKNKNILRQEAECSFSWMGKYFFFFFA